MTEQQGLLADIELSNSIESLSDYDIKLLTVQRRIQIAKHSEVSIQCSKQIEAFAATGHSGSLLFALDVAEYNGREISMIELEQLVDHALTAPNISETAQQASRRLRTNTISSLVKAVCL